MFMRCSREKNFKVLFTPTATSHVTSFLARGAATVTVLDDCRPRLYVHYVDGRLAVGDARHQSSSSAELHNRLSIERWYMVQEIEAGPIAVKIDDSKTAPSLHFVEDGRIEHWRSEPAWFDAKDLAICHHKVRSRDGTPVHYFEIGQRRRPANAPRPTIMFGYGAWGTSLLPNYQIDLGKFWLALGGAAVIANVRGGGEYGEAWHDAGRRQGKVRSVEDFIRSPRTSWRAEWRCRRIGCLRHKLRRHVGGCGDIA